METPFKIVENETQCFEILEQEAELLARIKAKMGYVTAIRVLRMKFRDCHLVDAKKFVESLPPPPKTDPRCVRCGSMVFDNVCSFDSSHEVSGWEKASP